MNEEFLKRLEECWAEPTPVFPPEWANPNGMERYDAYLMFSGKRWNEVHCEDLPSYFCPLTLFTPYLPDFAAYYIASYLACFFCIDLDRREFIEDNIEYILRNWLQRPENNTLSDKKCQVILEFINLTQGDLDWMFDEIPGQWQEYVAGRCVIRPPDSQG